MSNIQRIDPGVRYSKALIHNNIVYISGQIADTTKDVNDVAAQTQEIVGLLDDILAKAGTNKSNLLSVTIYLKDISTFAQMNAVWDAWVDKNALPTRATVEGKLAAPNYLVEIVAIAAI